MIRTRAVWTSAMMAIFVYASAGVADEPSYRGLLGENNPKIRRDGDKTYVWAGGGPPTSAEAQWYDFTGSPIPPEKLQFGIGKDRIRSIDDPVFVEPDDERLMDIPVSPYRPSEKPDKIDDIMVIGWVEGDDARAYPIALLDGHELVNDRFGDKPLLVGW